MTWLLYFAIAVFATALGAVTGMGGGVIIKPVLDMLGHCDAASISMLSSLTVLAMAVVSLLQHRKSVGRPAPSVAVPLALGAVLGGNLGGLLLNMLLAGGKSAGVMVVQNAVLALLILAVFAYMLCRHRLPSPKLSGVFPSSLAGLFLGVASSFLGIGGGPINVALIIFLFGYQTKTATLCSLLIILFSQASKILLAALAGGFGGYDLSMLPAMLAGAVAGGFLGGRAHKRISGKQMDVLFNVAQVVVFCLCVFNVLRNR